MRKDLFLLEKETAEYARKCLEEKHRMEMRIMAIEGERKRKLLDLEIETAQFKRDLAKRQLDLS